MSIDIESIIKLLAVLAQPIADLLKDLREKRRAKNQHLNPQSESRAEQNVSIPATTIEIPKDDPTVKDFNKLVKNGKYDEAVIMAPLERAKISLNEYSDDPLIQLALDDFDVWHARSLIYTGGTVNGENGLTRLDKIIKRITDNYNDAQLGQFYTGRKQTILGRAHNDKGYAHWMELGHHEIALLEFSEAIKQYNKVDPGQKNDELQDYIATAYDNLGRIYSQLGNQFRAEVLIEKGKRIRSTLGKDRYALSLNSSAISYLAFGYQDPAQDLSERALKYFEQTGSIRGKGLAQITMGQAQRHRGELWFANKDRDKGIYLEHLNSAKETLEGAKETFTKISEPIRNCQIYNELGCVHRELTRLTGDYSATFDQALAHFEQSIRIAENYNYSVLQADGLEDLAQLFKIVNDVTKTRMYIEKAKQVIRNISPNYFYQRKKGEKTVPADVCIEDFWQQLGKVYALKGHLVLDAQNKKGKLSNQPIANAIREPMENYVLAAGYFGRFLETANTSSKRNTGSTSMRSMLMNHRAFGKQVYEHFQELEFDKGKIVVIEDTIRKIKDDYCIKDDWIDLFFDEIIDLLKQTNP